MTASGYRRRERRKNRRNPYRRYRRRFALGAGPTAENVRVGPVRWARVPSSFLGRGG